MPFRLAAKEVFLTYAQYDHSREDLLAFLKDKGTLCAYAICRETHEDGLPHLHALCRFSPRIDTTDERYFDFGGSHPNIKKVGSRQVDWDNCLAYVQKEDTTPLINAERKRRSSWGDLLQKESEDDFWLMAAEHFPREYIINNAQLSSFAAKKYKKEEKYKPSFDWFNPPESVLDYLSGNFEEPRPCRPKSLVLSVCSNTVSPSRYGKTEWARSLGPHVYIQAQFSIDAFPATCPRYVVWDDVPFERVPARKVFFGSQHQPFFLSDKYRGKRRLHLNGAITIFLCNPDQDPTLSLEWNSWYESNCVVVRLSRPLF